jgi:hypothetical protein
LDSLVLGADFDLLKVLQSFPKGVGCDATGWRAQHLLDAVRESSLPAPLRREVVKVVNLLLSGKVSSAVQEYLAGGQVVALLKPAKSGESEELSIDCVLSRPDHSSERD